MSIGSRLPSLFIGHGNPMNAVQDNAWTRARTGLGAALPRPSAVICISAHWYVPQFPGRGLRRRICLHA